MPEIPPEVPRLSALSAEDVAQALKALRDWRLVETSVGPGGAFLQQALQRSFCLRSFLEAMAFLQTLVEPLEALGHHPRIENTWRELTLTFTTWDVGHRLTELDVQAAETVERRYQAFVNQLPAAN